MGAGESPPAPVPPPLVPVLRRLRAWIRATMRLLANIALLVVSTLQRMRAWARRAAGSARRYPPYRSDSAARTARVDVGRKADRQYRVDAAPAPSEQDTPGRVPDEVPDGPGKRRKRAQKAFVERWTGPSGTGVFYREWPSDPGSPVLLHIHGFGLSGSYLVPTADRLSGDFRNLVPDLPGFGRSHRAAETLNVPDMAHAAASFLDAMGVESATLVGNSMGCAVICEFAHLYPERLDRAILVAPAGGVHNQPLHRAVRQLARDSLREPTRLVPVAVPDYLHFGVPSTVQLFRALTQYPTLERLLDLRVPTLGVMGDRDPLMPGPGRLKEIADQQETHSLLVIIEGAAHAINFSHPGELANVVRTFMIDQPILDDPDSPGLTRSYEIHRGLHLPPAS